MDDFPIKTVHGVQCFAPSPLFPEVYVPVKLDEHTVRDLSMAELCDAMKACFYSEPYGTDTMRCARLLAAIHDAFRRESY